MQALQALQARNNDGRGGTYNCKLHAQVSGRSVAIAATLTQQRTAVTPAFDFVFMIYPPVAFTASLNCDLG